MQDTKPAAFSALTQIVGGQILHLVSWILDLVERIGTKKRGRSRAFYEINEPGRYWPGGFLNSWMASLLLSWSERTIAVA